MSLTSLTINKQYSNDSNLSEAIFDAAFGSVASWANVNRVLMPDKTTTDTITGVWTLATPKITGASSGKVTLQYANSANSRTITFPDPSANDSVAYLAATQTLAGKTFTSSSISDPTITGTTVLPSVDPPAANAATRSGPIKAWGLIGGDYSGGTYVHVYSYNIASVSKVAEGRCRVTWDRPFASANYAVVVTGYMTQEGALSLESFAHVTSITATYVEVDTYVLGSPVTGGVELNFTIMASGDQ